MINGGNVSVLAAPFLLLFLLAPSILLLGIVCYVAVRAALNPPEKSRLRVVPRVLCRRGEESANAMYGVFGHAGVIAICNVGRQTALCVEVGFLPCGANREWFRLREPKSLKGEAWPLELKPGETTLVAAAPEELAELFVRGQESEAYVRTSMGDLWVATPHDMRVFRRDVIDGWVRPRSGSARDEGGAEGMGEVSPA